MDRSVEKFLKTFGAAVLILVVVSIAAGYAPLVIKTSAQAVSVTFNDRSSENLNPAKVIEIVIEGTFSADQIPVQVRNPNGVPLTVTTLGGGPLVASRAGIGSNRFVIYLGGPNVNLTQNPANPLIPKDDNSGGIYPGYPKVNFLNSFATIASGDFGSNIGKSLSIYIVPTGQSFGPIKVGPVVPTVVITPKDVAYRRDALIFINLTDQDLDKDPTAIDTYSYSDLANITVRVTIVRPGQGQATGFTTLKDLALSPSETLTETSVRSGNFMGTAVSGPGIATSVSQLNSVLSVITPGFSPLKKGDRVILEFSGLHGIQGDPTGVYGTSFDDPDYGGDYFNAVYRQPSITVDPSQYSVSITINSPDDNANPNAKDCLDIGTYWNGTAGFQPSPANISITIRDAQNNPIVSDEKNVTIICNTFGNIETDKNTGVFSLSLDVFWSDTFDVNITGGYIVFQAGFKGPFKIEVRYYTLFSPPLPPTIGRLPEYGVDVIGVGVYYPQLANLSVVKATLKIWNISVTDKDLNIRSDTLEVLTPCFSVSGGTPPGCASQSFNAPIQASFDIWKLTPNVSAATGHNYPRVAKIEIRDENGNPVYVVPNTKPSDVITFYEPDFDVNTFILTFNPDKLCRAPLASCTPSYKVQPGQIYFIHYTDYTGFDDTTGKVVLQVVVAPIKIELDRSVYPINITNGVVVYIRYINDILNTRADQIEFASATITLYDANGNIVPPAACGYPTTVTLMETSADSGEFVSVNPLTGTYGGIRIPAACFTPSMIGGKIVVVSNDPYGVKAEATFQPFPASISVNATVVRYGDYVQVIVEHPDANTDSNATETITVNMTTIHGLSKKITLVEDGTNSSRFVGVVRISWDDPDQEGRVYPNDVIFFKYDDLTPPTTLPTASAWLPETKVTQVRVASTYGDIQPSTAVPNAVGLFETFNVYVYDPDLDRYVFRIDRPPIDEGYVFISTTRPETGAPVIGQPVGLVETDVHTGNFTAITGLSLVNLLLQQGVITQSDVQNPFKLAQSLAPYVGRTINITYADVYNPSGNVRLVVKSLVIKAFNPSLSTTPSDFVDLGSVLTITVWNPTVAGTTIADYRSVIVRVDNRNFIKSFYMTEIAPGVFQVNLTVVKSTLWIGQPGSTDIPAEIGDVINITYIAPVTEDGRVYVPFSKVVTVGKLMERPFNVPSIVLTLPNGTPVQTLSVGQTVRISFSVANQDQVPRTTTVFLIVRDSRGVAVFEADATLTVPPGSSIPIGISWTPFNPGDYTIEIRVVKSFTDLTPLSVQDIYTLTVSVSGS